MCVCVSVQEKAMGNRPSEMMDREKAYIPELQISFMEHIAMPIYKCVQKAFTCHFVLGLGLSLVPTFQVLNTGTEIYILSSG